MAELSQFGTYINCLDTTGTLIWISGVLVIVTIILNIISISLYKNRL